MELDFKTVKALSSSTRIRILRLVLQGDYSPTEISDEIERSKSTVASHLEHLQKAGLVEKDKKEGRRRVLYSSTRKAKAIVEGKERKVKFSIASSAITGLAGIGLIVTERIIPLETGGGSSTSGQAGTMGTMSMEASRTTVENASGSPDAVLYAGLGLIILALLTLVYGLTIRNLTEE